MGSKIGKQVSEGKKFLVVKAPSTLLSKEEALLEAEKKIKASSESSISFLVVEVVSEARKHIEVVMANLG